jgi:hypothetical protein
VKPVRLAAVCGPTARAHVVVGEGGDPLGVKALERAAVGVALAQDGRPLRREGGGCARMDDRRRRKWHAKDRQQGDAGGGRSQARAHQLRPAWAPSRTSSSNSSRSPRLGRPHSLSWYLRAAHVGGPGRPGREEGPAGRAAGGRVLHAQNARARRAHAAGPRPWPCPATQRKLTPHRPRTPPRRKPCSRGTCARAKWPGTGAWSRRAPPPQHHTRLRRTRHHHMRRSHSHEPHSASRPGPRQLPLWSSACARAAGARAAPSGGAAGRRGRPLTWTARRRRL